MRRLFCIAICLLASMSAFAQYGTTKQYEYRYSSKEHKLKIQVDYPKKGNPAFLRRVRSFIMEALEFDPYSGAASIGRYNGDPSDGQAVINYYGTAGVPLLKKRCAAYEWEAMEEERVIKRIAENDYYVTFEVKVLIWASSYGYNPVIDCYGETFRKSDGKKLNIIANSQSPQFKKLLNDRFPEDMKGFMYNDETDIPIPETEPYLLKDGVRFVYQMREVTAPETQYIQEDITFPEIQQFLTQDVRDVIGYSSSLEGNHHEAQTSSMQRTQAWFVFGTRNELMVHGILKDGQVLRGNFNKDYYTKIDTRIDKEIKLYSKSAKILTSHPANAYTLKPDANKLYVLRISDPNLFWSTSEYLVILVE